MTLKQSIHLRGYLKSIKLDWYRMETQLLQDKNKLIEIYKEYISKGRYDPYLLKMIDRMEAKLTVLSTPNTGLTLEDSNTIWDLIDSLIDGFNGLVRLIFR